MTITRRTPGSGHCPRPDDPAIELIHIDCAGHTYPDGSVGIHDMCFSVLKNEIVAICGPNGSGKSTLIEHLNGILSPTEGEVRFGGKSVTHGEYHDLWKEVGVVFQRSDDQLFAPTVLDDVMFGPVNLGVPRDEARAAALEALEAVGAANLIRKIPGYLSGGQKRLVSIAGVLAMKPRVIALDEPTSDLDPVHAGIIERLVLELKERHGISVVIATHDLDLAARVADRICLVRNGSVFAEGPPREVFYDPALVKEAGLVAPETVRTYLAYCAVRGTEPVLKPVWREELVEAFRSVP